VKLLVFGAGGQLGRTLARACPYPDASFLDRAAVDLADAATIGRAIAEIDPDLVINAAAYTAVDRAETDATTAYAINETAPAVIARGCAAAGARLIHLSTDYVFDGTLRRPYTPVDATRPLNVYGASKLAGERRIAECTGLDYLIVRTSWVYADVGRNFLLTMLKAGNEKKHLRVVGDQYGSPTSCWSLAKCLWGAAEAPALAGIAHFTDGAAISWYDFALAIFEDSGSEGLLTAPVTVDSITSAEYPTPAARPAYSVLDSAQTYEKLGLGVPDWRSELRFVVRKLARSGQ
jgi:dTDP-4-dehydrorhamnose reductase